jgi:lysylphosphatidylglycerol synthetase-like protein (DUF2156 family)
MLKGPSLIAIAIFIGGIVFIAGGIILFSGAANFSDSVKENFQVNATSGVKSMIAKTAANALEPVIKAFTQITRGIITSLASFLSLVGVGLCFLGIGLHKTKYLAWVLTIILMFVAIVIDVVGLGFVSGSLSDSGNSLVYALIAALAIHLIANAFIIYYLTRKNTASMFRNVNS